ncbi:phage portal protein [Snodgrassella alvi]|nr:phage portal protein [Snodgrassella alvi]
MSWLKRLFRKKSSPKAGGGWQSICESARGTWQFGMRMDPEDVNSFFAVFACISKISQDISKLPLLTKIISDGVWQTQELKGYDFILKPNHYQTLQQFFERWVQSKLFKGNTYVYKERDIYGKVKNLHVLHPDRVQPLVADNGEVYYQIANDRLSMIGDSSIILPASEVIHDRWNCFYHPLVGLSPVVACKVSVDNGLAIQANSRTFFKNQSRPSGILTTPGSISEETAKLIRERWNSAYGGQNQGGTAVLGDDMKYQTVTMSAADSQLIEQLRLSAEIVCSAFKMPPFLIGLASLPNNMKVEDLNEIYYSGCLQTLIEAIENLLTQEVVTDKKVSIEFDLDSLIRMNSTTLMGMLKEGVSSALMTPNEARQRIGLCPVEGGDTPYLQQQNFSLSALAKRDAKEDPFAGKTAKNMPAESEIAFKAAYAGVFNKEVAYLKGQFVTKSGSLWAVLNDHCGNFDHANFKLCSKDWIK